jgi:glutathione peroxidase
LTRAGRLEIFRPMKTTLALILALAAMNAFTAEPKPNLADIPLKDINGKDTSLKAYKGEVLLIVNVASKCGYTPQYKSLEATYRKYKDQGLVVLGFPCNQFGGQEPGSNEEIKAFCSANYDVTFPLFDKLDVKGAKQHPLYAALSGKDSPFPGDVKWNFGKFLVSKDGKILKRWDSATKPDSKEVTEAIEAALAAK